MYVHTSSIQIGNVIANDKDYSNEQCHIVKFCNEKKKSCIFQKPWVEGVILSLFKYHPMLKD